MNSGTVFKRPCDWTASSVLKINDRIKYPHTHGMNEWFYFYCFQNCCLNLIILLPTLFISRIRVETFVSSDNYESGENWRNWKNCQQKQSVRKQLSRLFFSIYRKVCTNNRYLKQLVIGRAGPLIPIQIIENAITTIQFLMSFSPKFPIQCNLND